MQNSIKAVENNTREPLIITPKIERLMGHIIGVGIFLLAWISFSSAILLDFYRQLRIPHHDPYTLTGAILMGVGASSMTGAFAWIMLQPITVRIVVLEEKFSVTGSFLKPQEIAYSQIAWMQIKEISAGRNGVVPVLEIVPDDSAEDENRFTIRTKAFDPADLSVLIKTAITQNPMIKLDERAQRLFDGREL